MFSYEEAQERIPSQLERILQALRNAGPDGVTNIELNKICLKYDARISDLRRKGYVIRTESLGKGVYKYYLIKTPSQDYIFPKAQEQTILAVLDTWGIDTALWFEDYLKEQHFKVSRNHGWYEKNVM